MINLNLMSNEDKDLKQIHPDELDRELLSRDKPGPGDKRFDFQNRAGTPLRNGFMNEIEKLYKAALTPNESLHQFLTMEFRNILRLRATSSFRNPYISFEWMEAFQVYDDDIKQNTLCTAAIVMGNELRLGADNRFALETENYGNCFNLCPKDPFSTQPIVAGPVCTGFLVKEDVMVTSAPWITGESLEDLRIVFDYRMQDAKTSVTHLPHENIYRAVKFLRCPDNSGDNSGWVLLKLDRRVEDRSPVELNDKEIEKDKVLYTVGHPVGLPLKQVSGPRVLDVPDDNYFYANLGMYGSGSGSPVFANGSDKVVGFVEHIFYPGLRWTGECWFSIANGLSGYGTKGVRCTVPGVFAEALNSF